MHYSCLQKNIHIYMFTFIHIRTSKKIFVCYEIWLTYTYVVLGVSTQFERTAICQQEA
jgi:hypothetical protein